LQLAFPRTGTAREDIQNELRAIEDFSTDGLLEIAELGRRELVVEDHHVDVRLIAGRCQGLDLSAAEKGRGVGARALLQQAQHHVRARRRRETCELVE
jgi:hypothetical protein